jgi:hypothetical protein
MIDRRTVQVEECEIEPGLSSLTDSEILLNFRGALAALYPRLIPIDAYCWDPFDGIVESLFDAMTYDVFSWKYGVAVAPRKYRAGLVGVPIYRHHQYGFRLRSYRAVHHIECIPRRFPLPLFRPHEPSSSFAGDFTVSETDLLATVLVFMGFGDGRNNLTGTSDDVNPESVAFDLVEVMLASAATGEASSAFGGSTLWLDPADVEFAFVAEDVRDE